MSIVVALWLKCKLSPVTTCLMCDNSDMPLLQVTTSPFSAVLCALPYNESKEVMVPFHGTLTCLQVHYLGISAPLFSSIPMSSLNQENKR